MNVNLAEKTTMKSSLHILFHITVLTLGIVGCDWHGLKKRALESRQDATETPIEKRDVQEVVTLADEPIELPQLANVNQPAKHSGGSVELKTKEITVDEASNVSFVAGNLPVSLPKADKQVESVETVPVEQEAVEIIEDDVELANNEPVKNSKNFFSRFKEFMLPTERKQAEDSVEIVANSAGKESSTKSGKMNARETFLIENNSSLDSCIQIASKIPDEPYFYQLQSRLRKSNESDVYDLLKGHASHWGVKSPSKTQAVECKHAILALERYQWVRKLRNGTKKDNIIWMASQIERVNARDIKVYKQESPTRLAH